MTKSHGQLVTEVNGKTDEGLETFYTPTNAVKEVDSTTEDVAKSPKERSSTSDSRHSSLGEADQIPIEKTVDGSLKNDSKPDVKKKTWNPFSRDRGKISIFAKKPKGDSPKLKHASPVEDKPEPKMMPEIKPEVSEGVGAERTLRLSSISNSESRESAELPEKPKKLPMVPLMDENVLAEMKKKREIRTSLKDLTVSTTNSSDVNESANDEESMTKRASRNSCLLATDNPQESPIAIAQEDKKKQCINLDKYFPSSEDVGSKENQSPLSSSKDKHAPLPPIPMNRSKSTDKPSDKLSEEMIENSLEKSATTPLSPSKMEEKSIDMKVYEKSDAEKLSEDRVNKEKKEMITKSDEPTASTKPKPVPRTKGLLPPKPKPPPPVAPKPAVPSRPSIRKSSSPNGPSTDSTSSKDAGGVVYDSNTLRLSVKEKISWLSQTKAVLKSPTETNDKLEEEDEDSMSGKKSSSLPRNTQIPSEFKESDSEVQSRPYSMFCELQNELSSISSRSTPSNSSSSNSNKKDTSSNSSLSPLSKVLNPQLLNLSTDGLDTSRLSMCSSHHSSTDEVESDGEIIFL